jgi:hypothetical protein
VFWLGAVGFAMVFFGGMAVAVLSFVYAESMMPGPYSWGDGSGRGVAVLVWEVGLLLLGIATMRARALPFPRKALPLANFLVFAFSIMLASLMLGAGLGSEFFYSGVSRALAGIGWVLLGYALWSERGEDARLPAAARWVETLEEPPVRGSTDFKGRSQICALSRYLQKVSKFLVPSPLQSVTSGVSFLSVGWCDAKPTQLKSPGRYSSFPFPHLSPLRALRALPLFRACQRVGDWLKRERRDLRIPTYR